MLIVHTADATTGLTVRACPTCGRASQTLYSCGTLKDMCQACFDVHPCVAEEFMNKADTSRRIWEVNW